MIIHLPKTIIIGTIRGRVPHVGRVFSEAAQNSRLVPSFLQYLFIYYGPHCIGIMFSDQGQVDTHREKSGGILERLQIPGKGKWMASV